MSSSSHDAIVESQHAAQDTTTKPSVEQGKFVDGMNGHDEKKVIDGEAPPPMKKIIDWPRTNIKDPHDNDVLFGRGGGTNHHPGNKRYRKMVEDRKMEYVDAKRLDKPLVALDIIRVWRSQDPPGRFLKLDEKTGLWIDVGDKKAREKTSQALREKAPLIRKQMDDKRKDGDDDDDYDDDDDDNGDTYPKGKSTRFAEGTNLEGRNGSSRPTLARDHSLGREILDEGEAVTLDGFSWQDPFRSRNPSQGSVTSDRVPSSGPPPPGPYPYDARYPSYGSGAPPPPAPYGPGPMGSDRYPSGRYESWGSNYSMPPPVPGYGYPPPHHGSWSQRDGSWSQRDHSLCHNPLPYANVAQAAPAPYFDARHGSWSRPPPSWGPPPPDGRYESWGSHYSGSWAPPPPRDGRTGSWGPPPHMPPYGHPTHYHHSGSHGPPPPPPPQPSHGPPRPVPGTVSRSPASSASPSPPKKSPPKAPNSPLYTVDPKVASKWSGRDEVEIQKSMSGESNTSEETDRFDANFRRPAGRIIIDARPDLIKRATSNQNETAETKPDLKGPSVKRAALNRDSSAAANRLKEQYVPGFQKRAFNADKEVRALSQNLEHSWPGVRPTPFTESERMSTIDSIAMDLIVKPVVFSNSTRSSTIEALDLDLDDTPSMYDKPNGVSRSRTMEEIMNDWKDDTLKDFVPKPPVLSGGDRLTTNDYLTIIKEPIDDEGLSGDELELDKPSILSRESSLTERWVTGGCD